MCYSQPYNYRACNHHLAIMLKRVLRSASYAPRLLLAAAMSPSPLETKKNLLVIAKLQMNPTIQTIHPPARLERLFHPSAPHHQSN